MNVADEHIQNKKLGYRWQTARRIYANAMPWLTKQEAQLMLTTGSTRLLAVSRARAISDGTLT